MAKSEMKHTFTLTVGDWSMDGHNISEKFAFKSNKSHKEIEKLHGMASAMHGLDLKSQCKDYEDSKFDEDFTAKLREVFGGYPEVIKLLDEASDEDNPDNIEYVDSDLYSELYLWIAKLVSADLEWAPVQRREANINIGGYGLFYA